MRMSLLVLSEMDVSLDGELGLLLEYTGKYDRIVLIVQVHRETRSGAQLS